MRIFKWHVRRDENGNDQEYSFETRKEALEFLIKSLKRYSDCRIFKW